MNSRQHFETSVVHFLLVFVLLTPASTVAQVTRDSAGIAAVTNSIGVMGSLPPQDSTATANITLSGTSLMQGTLQFTTRRLDQTAEHVVLPSGTQNLIFSQGSSNDLRPDAKPGEDPASFELSLTAQSPLFPLPWLASRYANSDVAIQYVGNDSIGGIASIHLRLTNTFASNPNNAHYSNFTASEVWLDAKTYLPVRISYERRDAGGPVPTIPIAYEYSDYRNVQGILYPFQVRKFVNGVLWGTISVQSVQFNSGVSSTAFALQ